jgi:hypothetical protein
MSLIHVAVILIPVNEPTFAGVDVLLYRVDISEQLNATEYEIQSEGRKKTNNILLYGGRLMLYTVNSVA